MTVCLNDIHAAAAAIRDDVPATPSIVSRTLSDRTGAEVVLKLENLQMTGSFKARGAAFKLKSLLERNGRPKGVVAASAGNHAQGVACHARRLGLAATIVMPKGTPFLKTARTEAYGARVVLEGGDLSAAEQYAVAMAAREGWEFIHPYDDLAIIAGQGTVGLELMSAHPDLDALIVPIGGGGLISGIATAAKALKPDIEIVGVQTALYPSMVVALKGGTPGPGWASLAEGISVKRPGTLTTPVVRALVDDIVLIDEMAVEMAVECLVDSDHIVAEGAGAASLAALLGNRDRFAGRKVGLIVSGGNIDSRLLASVLMRGLVRSGRLVRLRIQIGDTPGSLAQVSKLIGDCDGNIVEVSHQRLFEDTPVKRAELDVVVETTGVAHMERLLTCLRDAGYAVRLLSRTAFGDAG